MPRTVKAVAFDAKPFERGNLRGNQKSGDRGGAGTFKTQLGIGVSISDKEAFRDRFTAKFAEIRGRLKLSEQLPVCPSSRLRSFGDEKAAELGGQLVDSVQDLIEDVHCFFVILPPDNPSTVRVGGAGGTGMEIPTWLFVKNLGPMFSYMTAQNYLYSHSGLDAKNMEFHIDAFSSKRTRAWDILVDKVEPKAFWRGDECNPFIACADILTFLTDDKLHRQHLKLNRQNITKVWKNRKFKTTAHYVTRNALAIHAWYTNEEIDAWPYVARPTVFLAVDSMARDRQAGGGNAVPGATAPDPEGAEQPRTASKVFAKSAVYAAAVRYAFNHSGSFKFFSRYEDSAHVHDHDIFVYAGPESERIGRVLQDTSRVKAMSGLEPRDKVKKIVKEQS